MEVEEQVCFKDWMPMEKPRERLKKTGAKSLSHAELLALLLRTGTRGKSCLDLSRKVLAVANNNLDALGDLPLSALRAVSGLGEAQAMTIMAAMELRKRNEPEVKRPKVVSSADAFAQLREELSDLLHEEFWVLCLNQASKLILKKQISAGGTNSTVVDPRIVMKLAVMELSHSIILAHNHPSGNLTPSQADLDLTHKLIAAGKLFDIQVVDHLILAGKNYCSFADSGLM